ncbi:unnamed protein product [Notodromas monacha]|uniref:Uncharacterized protein n=1 Tax=Notodromas monacha TaxID=399045 RepID=A0A7R9BM40_9CRUS|nr:unnamed protein product [Notodromas monacha]CAG0916664.1 unnamed protein product [Notodromas monacha]
MGLPLGLDAVVQTVLFLNQMVQLAQKDPSLVLGSEALRSIPTSLDRTHGMPECRVTAAKDSLRDLANVSPQLGRSDNNMQAVFRRHLTGPTGCRSAASPPPKTPCVTWPIRESFRHRLKVKCSVSSPDHTTLPTYDPALFKEFIPFRRLPSSDLGKALIRCRYYDI